MYHCRAEGQTIIYINRTYIHSIHTKTNGWRDDSEQGLLAPVSRRQMAKIAHAGEQQGLIKDALLIFKPQQKSGDKS
jgi:hypothetical protein